MKLTKLSPDIGTKVENINIKQPLTEQQILTIRKALAESGVVVIPTSGLTESEQIAFTGQFGVCKPHPAVLKRWLKKSGYQSDDKYAPKEVRAVAPFKIKNTPSFEQIFYNEKINIEKINATKVGKQRTYSKNENKSVQIMREFNAIPKDPRAVVINPTGNNERWHSDITAEVLPPACSCLHMIKVAPDGRGDTMFASMYNVYNMLSPGMRKTLKTMEGVHYERRLGNKQYQMPHPAIICHPETKRPAVFLNTAFCPHFKNWTQIESQPILEYIEKIASMPQNIYRHKWTQGDLVMWDNRCMLHFAVKDYDPSIKGMERVVRRTNWYDGVLPSLNPKEVPRKVFPYDQSEFSIRTIEKYKGYMPEDVLPSIETSRL